MLVKKIDDTTEKKARTLEFMGKQWEAKMENQIIELIKQNNSNEMKEMKNINGIRNIISRSKGKITHDNNDTNDWINDMDYNENDGDKQDEEGTKEFLRIVT
jgi:hypothetical protein